MATFREERIRQLAHEIWEKEGHPHGRDAEHWRLATEAYEAEVFSSRLDDAGQPVDAGAGVPQEGAMRSPSEGSKDGAPAAQPVPSLAATRRNRRTKAEMEAARAAEAMAPKAGRRRKAQLDAALLPTEPVTDTAPLTRRKRRTKAEMAAAAAGVAGVAGAAAAVAAAVAVTKRRRGVKAEAVGEAAPAPAADAALRPPRKPRAGTTLSEAEPTSAATAHSATLGADPDPSADGPAEAANDLMPDPGLIPDPAAEPPR